MSKRKNYKPAFPVRAALEAIKSERTVAELVSHFGVHDGARNIQALNLLLAQT